MNLKKVFSIAAIVAIVFVGGCKKDEVTIKSPTVVSTTPLSNATSVAINSNISATFSMAMDSATIIPANFYVMQGIDTIAGEFVFNGNTATFSPSANLISNATYTATISKKVKASNGKFLENAHVWSFTTSANADAVLPTIILTNPANNDTGVVVTTPVVITFSETMDATSISSSTVVLKLDTEVVAAAVTYSELKATITPNESLKSGKSYTVVITTNVKDMAGNAIDSEYSFVFTTKGVPVNLAPAVLSTDPLNNATGVARNKVIEINFNKTMDPLTITTTTFTVNQGANPVLGVVELSGNKATFTPNDILTAGLVYTVTLTSAVKDLEGVAIAANSTWSFTTSATAASLAVVDLGAAGNYVLLAKTAINNISTSAVTGDIGLSPAATSYITGFSLTNATGYATSAQITGNIYAADMAPPTNTNLTTAVENMITAYNDAAGRSNPDFVELNTGNIGGKTLTPGLYKWTNSVTMNSDVTISGNANDVWIFQIAGNMDMSNAVKITLIGGAQAKNIFWQVAGSVTFGTTSQFKGVVLSQTSITFQTGASMNGKALAQTAIVLDGNAITKL